MDPVQTETIGKKRTPRPGGTATTGGIAAFAISGIDIALWDLKGKALGASLVDLLGGPVHERLPAIASSHAHFDDIGEMVEEIAGVALDRPDRASRSASASAATPASATSTIATSRT